MAQGSEEVGPQELGSLAGLELGPVEAMGFVANLEPEVAQGLVGESEPGPVGELEPGPEAVLGSEAKLEPGLEAVLGSEAN